MTNSLIIPEKNWFAIREKRTDLPKPFERTISLGEFDVLGLVHMDNPSFHFRHIRNSSKLTLRCRAGICEVIKDEIVFGHIPAREGNIFNCLLLGGKKLIAKVLKKSVAGLEPELSVEVIMEEF